MFLAVQLLSFILLEIPNFLTDEECQTIINLASREGLDTSEVQDPEIGINIEPTNEKTFHSWDYNGDGVIDKVEVSVTDELRTKDKTRLWKTACCFTMA